MTLTLVIAACVVCVVGWFALPGGSPLLDEPLQTDGDDLVLHSETWWLDHQQLVVAALPFAIVAATLAGAGVELFAAVLAAIAIVVAVVGYVIAWLRNGPVTVRLTRSELVLPRRTLALAAIRSVEVVHRAAGKEVNFEEFTKRDLRLELADGSHLFMRLPIRDAPSERFEHELRRRIEAAPRDLAEAVATAAPAPLPTARLVERDHE